MPDHEYTIEELERVIQRLTEIAKRHSGLGEDVDLMIAVHVLQTKIQDLKKIILQKEKDKWSI